MLTIVVISTVIIILTAFVLIIIEKEHKRPLSISFDLDFQSSKDSITFINYIFRRGKFKRFKHYFPFFINQGKFKRLRIFTFFIFLNIF